MYRQKAAPLVIEESKKLFAGQNSLNIQKRKIKMSNID
jgi:hypothetical protein